LRFCLHAGQISTLQFPCQIPNNFPGEIYEVNQTLFRRNGAYLAHIFSYDDST